MFETIWGFVNNPANQTTLTWLGGGFVIVAGGIWTLVQFFAKKPETPKMPPTITASDGGVIIARDNINSDIFTNKGGVARKK